MIAVGAVNISGKAVIIKSAPGYITENNNRGRTHTCKHISLQCIRSVISICANSKSYAIRNGYTII